MQKKLVEFFETHPEVNTAFHVLGVVFTDYNKANSFAGGTGKKPETVTRDQYIITEGQSEKDLQNDADGKTADLSGNQENTSGQNDADSKTSNNELEGAIAEHQKAVENKAHHMVIKKLAKAIEDIKTKQAASN